MKAPLLLALSAVTAVAASADLKDPAQVALDWNTTANEARRPLVDLLDLKAQVADQRYPGLNQAFAPEGPKGPRPTVAPPPQLFDAPASPSRPDPLNALPRGSKRWQFNGADYWLVPLGN
ncbi:MAG TPA: hypothetical protein VHD61_00300 [Lacunisphaera sp.]|nr:hypothetical protein [Lacunisphaera sp.]